MTMAGLAAVFWGSMGVAGQNLLQNCHFTPMDLISIRMLLAGSIFVGIVSNDKFRYPTNDKNSDPGVKLNNC